MTAERALELIGRGETLDVEFKGDKKKQFSDTALVEVVVCLANRREGEPGWLFIGVEDDGRITGARPRHGKRTDLLRLQAMIANRTEPPVTTRVEEICVDDLPVIVVEAPVSRAPVGTSEGKYLRRVLGGDAPTKSSLSVYWLSSTTSTMPIARSGLSRFGKRIRHELDG